MKPRSSGGSSSNHPGWIAEPRSRADGLPERRSQERGRPERLLPCSLRPRMSSIGFNVNIGLGPWLHSGAPSTSGSFRSLLGLRDQDLLVGLPNDPGPGKPRYTYMHIYMHSRWHHSLRVQPCTYSLACMRSLRRALQTRIISSLSSPVELVFLRIP